eukprot:CAMPEP_0206325346 /NCGR_PEP_ID=MMETSP0106_2-20121207/21024_1 /ASSEMBLY_ACC=CAM_ASM_000206 /TAXON_ID=81532 /ORGANISM="Acanthoeca-like sp., Strain 10tr" /LENGTH=31 /DNA_ID= /DNA_START= /DNA_END= /DNA_ORIENTATION=
MAHPGFSDGGRAAAEARLGTVEAGGSLGAPV